MQQSGSAMENGSSWRIEAFAYPAGPDAPPSLSWDGYGAGVDEGSPPDHARGVVEAAVRAEFELKVAEETRRAFEAGRERGRLEGRQTEREGQSATHTAAQEQRVRQAAELIASFAQERDRYLHAVEYEVVELALRVAARILRREAQMDPLLLTGAVRVALGQLSGSTEVRLHVPAAELDLWTETMARLPRLPVKLEVVAGEGMRLGDCRIETALGSVDLGIRAQLGEIERGFFDRAGASCPQAAPETEAAASAHEVRS